MFLTAAPLVDWLVVAILTALALLQGLAYWKAGLSYSPDSGFYLLYAARLHLALDYAAGAAMYAPLFPGVIALAMFVAPYPGQAAIVVLTISACLALLASYGAARLCRAPPLVALAFGLLLFALPSTQHVFGYAWTEGLMLSILVLTPACYAAWVQTNKVQYLWIMLLASTAAPLIKYVAIFVPLITTVLVAQNIVRRRAGGTRWAQLGFCILMFIPALAHAGYNYQRWGTVTGHGPSKVTLARNFTDLSTAIVNTLGTSLPWPSAICGRSPSRAARRWRLDGQRRCIAAIGRAAISGGSLMLRIEHPVRPGVHADAGHDPVAGFFVDIVCDERVSACYDCFHPLFNRSRPVIGCLDFLVSQGFFTGDELEHALAFLQDGAATPSGMRVVEILMAFERAVG